MPHTKLLTRMEIILNMHSIILNCSHTIIVYHQLQGNYNSLITSYKSILNPSQSPIDISSNYSSSGLPIDTIQVLATHTSHQENRTHILQILFLLFSILQNIHSQNEIENLYSAEQSLSNVYQNSFSVCFIFPLPLLIVIVVFFLI